MHSLLQAYVRLAESLTGELPALALAGGVGWGTTSMGRLLLEAESRGAVRLGYAPDEHLPALYAGALAFVMPSTYEGFGLPVMEARACGAPTICTDTPELREAGGEGGWYVQPTSEGLLEALLEMCHGSKPQQAIGPLPSWEGAARVHAGAMALL